MQFDTFDDLFDSPATAAPAATPATYQIIPQGRAEVEIVAASIGDVQWKASDDNPAGTCLKLRLSAGKGFAFVFADLPRDRKFLFKALAAALGIQPGDDGKVSLPQPHELVGRTALVEVGHYQTKRGETKACVRKWLPAESVQPPHKPRPPRQAVQRSRNAVPQIGVDDDIPF